MLYIPANDNICGAIQGAVEVVYTAGKGYSGTVGGAIFSGYRAAAELLQALR